MQRPIDRAFQTIRQFGTNVFPSWNVQTVSIVVLLALAVIALFATQKQSKPSSLTDLFAGRALTPHELDEIEAALGNAVLADYRLENGIISVPVEKRGQYLSAIREANALPQSFHMPTEEALNNASVIETSSQRTQRFHHATEKKARLAICALPGVLDAYVHFDAVADQSYRRDPVSTAAVGVKTARGQQLNEQSFRAIQAMLLGFKAGLTLETITVTDLTSGEFFRGTIESQSVETIRAMRKADLERTWQRRLLSAIPFTPNAKLSVQVIPTEDALDTAAVFCSVSVPRDRYPNEAPATTKQSEAAIRHRVQSAILPLIPHNNGNIDEVIAVTVFESPETAAGSVPWAANPQSLIAAVLFGAAALVLLVLLRNGSPKRVVQEELAPSLRIYEGYESNDAHEPNQPDEQLRAFAAEDPTAVAESLSDFIDRAS